MTRGQLEFPDGVALDFVVVRDKLGWHWEVENTFSSKMIFENATTALLDMAKTYSSAHVSIEGK